MMDWMIFLGCVSGGCLIGWPVHAYVAARKLERTEKQRAFWETLADTLTDRVADLGGELRAARRERDEARRQAGIRT